MPRPKGFKKKDVRRREHLENALANLCRITLDLELVQLRIQQAERRTAGLHHLLTPADETVDDLLGTVKQYRGEIVAALEL
jgi:hypothetical protein